VRRLANAGSAVRAALVSSLHQLWEETLCWFGLDDDPVMHQLYQEGIIDATPDELRSRYLQKIMPTLTSLDIAVPAAFDAETKRWQPSQPLPWERWQAVSRRLDQNAI
jgi:1,2-phenylacetyl-CoA epoxidase catalytic subunit